MRVGRRPQATDEEHADPDEGDAGDLRRRRGVPEHHDRTTRTSAGATPRATG